MSYPTQPYLVALYHFFFYIVNSAVAIVVVFWFMDQSILNHPDKAFSYIMLATIAEL